MGSASLSNGCARFAVALSCAIVAAACSGGESRSIERQRPGASPEGMATPNSGSRPTTCEPVEPVVEAQGPSTEAEVLREADGKGPRVEAMVYPRPDYEAKLWSQWGQGLALPDGRFLSAVGDHEGADGNSFLFVFDPENGRLTRFADVLSELDHNSGSWGYGKIHGQMVLGPCNSVYFATYWGTRENIRYDATYTGDRLFRLDPATLELNDLGVPAPEHGIPSVAGFESDGFVYGEAADPNRDERDRDQGAFFVFDTAEGKVSFETEDQRHIGFRNILVDADGTAYLAAEGGRLLAYEPGATELAEVSERLPGGGWLRASTTPGPDGTVYGATQGPDQLFALKSDGQMRDLGAARGYTTSVALDPDGDRFYYVPDAHGAAWEQGTPVVAVDTDSGEQRVVAELNELAEKELDLTLGGSYNVAVDPSGDRLYVGFNAGRSREEPWGEVVLAIVHL